MAKWGLACIIDAMPFRIPRTSRAALLICWVMFSITACDREATLPVATVPLTPSLTPQPATPTPTALPPSPTPEPLAAMVNSEPITQAEYQAELARAQAALGESGDVSQRVLDDLIDQVLLAQGAAKAGFTVDEAMIQEHMDNLAAQVGGVSALVEWLSAHGYRETDFRRALGRSIAAAWMRDQIIAAVPQTAEQIHARQILLYNEEEANQVLDQLRAGTNFATLAAEYDPVASGDLGWFPSGYLTEPALDQAAFALQAGQYSEVIKTRLGYHILQVIERDPQRLLEPDARQALQEQALGQWLVEQRSQSQIEIYLP